MAKGPADMGWTEGADREALAALTRHADALYSEAEAIATRARAGAVSQEYVAQAALTLHLAAPSTQVADVLFGVGSLLAGGALGTALSLGVQPQPDVSGWLIFALPALGVPGILFFAVGATLKFTARR